MAVYLSLFAGAGQQFFTNAGVPLAGGKIFTYGAGGSTPQATYTTSAGNIAHSNPIVLDAAGRVPGGGEIWLSVGVSYKFVLQTSANVTIQTLDNIVGGNDPTAILATLAASNGSSLIGFIQAGSGAVARTVQARLRDTVNVKDFGADPTGVADSTAAIQAAIDYAQQRNYVVPQHYPTAINTVYIPTGLYKITSSLNITEGICLIGDGAEGTYLQLTVSSAVPAISINAAGGKQIWGSILQGFRIECFKGSAAGDGIKIRATAPSAVTQCRFSDIVILDHRNGLDIAGTAANEVYLNEFINIKCVGPTADGAGNSAQRYGVLANTGAYNSYINIECTQVSNSGYAFFINQVGIHAIQLTCDGACDFDSLFGTVDHLTIEEVYCVTPVAAEAIKVNRMQSFSNITLIEVPNSEFTTGLNIFGTGGLDIRNVNIFTATANRPNTPIYLDATSGGTISNFIGSIAAKVETYLPAATLDRWSFIQSPALTDRNVGRSVYQTGYPTTSITFPAANTTSFTQNNVEVFRLKPVGSARFVPVTTPASAQAGDVYYDSGTNKLRCYNGTTWNDLF